MVFCHWLILTPPSPPSRSPSSAQAENKHVKIGQHPGWTAKVAYRCPPCRADTAKDVLEILFLEDKYGYFSERITEAQAPGYAEVIKNSMDLTKVVSLAIYIYIYIYTHYIYAHRPT
jgi:hypothetical protein